jgi:hypothetical protein
MRFGGTELLIVALLVLVVLLPAYLIPTIVGLVRKPPNLGVIAAINLLLGWTVIGWIAALVMALRPTQPSLEP